MGWTMLAINVAAIPIVALGAYIAPLVGESSGSVEAGIDFAGIILVLTLF